MRKIGKSDVKVGDRVTVIHYVNATNTKKEAHFFGSGVLKEPSVPSEDALGPLSAIARGAGAEVPTILLDSNEIVWGTEAWWGAESDVAEEANKQEWDPIVFDSISKVREEEKEERVKAQAEEEAQFQAIKKLPLDRARIVKDEDLVQVTFPSGWLAKEVVLPLTYPTAPGWEDALILLNDGDEGTSMILGARRVVDGATQLGVMEDGGRFIRDVTDEALGYAPVPCPVRGYLAAAFGKPE